MQPFQLSGLMEFAKRLTQGSLFLANPGKVSRRGRFPALRLSRLILVLFARL